MAFRAGTIERVRRGLGLALAAPVCALAACATTTPSPTARDLAAMRTDLQQQRSRDAALEARLDRLETRLSTLEASRAAPTPVDATASLPVVKLEPPPDETPVAAPPIDTSVDLREPNDASDAQLAGKEISVEPRLVDDAPGADGELARAEAKFDAGERREAARELAAFVLAHPHHPGAAHALYLVGLAKALDGRCEAGESDFFAVARDYPDDPAAADGLVAAGECEAGIGHVAKAREALSRVVRDAAGTSAAARAAADLAKLESRVSVAGRP